MHKSANDMEMRKYFPVNNRTNVFSLVIAR